MYPATSLTGKNRSFGQFDPTHALGVYPFGVLVYPGLLVFGFGEIADGRTLRIVERLGAVLFGRRGFPIARNQFCRFADPVHYGVTAILQRFHMKQVIFHNRKCLKVISRLAGVSLPAARRPPSEAPACQRTIRSEIPIFILVTPFILSMGQTLFFEGRPGGKSPSCRDGRYRDFKERGSSPCTLPSEPFCYGHREPDFVK